MFTSPATRLGRHRVAPQGSNGQVQIFSNNVFTAANGLVYSSSGNNFTVTGQHSTDVPLTVIGHSGATANLFEVANSSAILFAISSGGLAEGIGINSMLALLFSAI